MKVLVAGASSISTAGQAQQALSLTAPIMRKLEAEAALLASLR